MFQQQDDDESENSVGQAKSPVVVVLDDSEPPPPPPPRPSFITNREYTSSLMVFAVFAVLVCGVQWLATKRPNCCFGAAVALLVFLGEWERRARFTFGRIRQRAHFDPLGLARLPAVPSVFNVEVEPPTPFPQAEKQRSDPAAIVKLAQDTLSGGAASSAGTSSAMELALINMLKSSIDAKRRACSKAPGQEEKST